MNRVSRVSRCTTMLFVIGASTAASTHLWLSQTAYASQAVAASSTDSEPAQHNAVFEAKAYDAQTEEPLAGVTVSVGEKVVTTDAAGETGSVRLPAGEYEVSASLPSYAPYTQSFKMQPGGRQFAAIGLQRAGLGTITGQVTDAVSGKPIAGVQILTRGAQVETDREGRFTLNQSRRGSVRVRALHATYAAAAPRTVSPGDATDLRLTLQPRAENVIALEKALARDGFVDVYGIPFATGKHDIPDSALATLGAVVEVMKRTASRRYIIAAHTHIEDSGGDAQTLTLQRANAVVRWLIGQGIAAERLDAFGAGVSDPIAQGETQSAKALNRRVEIFVDE